MYVYINTNTYMQQEYGHIIVANVAAWANSERYHAVRAMLENYVKIKSDLIQTFEKLDFRTQVCS